MGNLIVRETNLLPFLRSGLRLLHCQVGGELLPRGFEVHKGKKWHDPRIRLTVKTRPDPKATFCGSLWNPGWGLHSDGSVVEVRMRPSARVVIFTHDVFSIRNADEQYSLFSWGDRRVGNSMCINKKCRTVTSPAHLGVFKREILRRSKEAGCSDPLNEVWFKWSDVLALRAIQVRSPERGMRINTHRTDIKIRVVSDWFEVNHGV